MTALLYLFVAGMAAVLATRAWLAESGEPARQAFLGLGWSVALAYGAFALSLIPGLAGLRVVYIAAAVSVPAFSLWVVDRLFGREDAWRPVTQRLAALTFIVAVGAPALHVAVYLDLPRSSPPEILAGIFAFFAFGATLWRLWDAHEAATLQVDRVRLRYLIALAGSALVFTLVEQLVRALSAPVDPTSLGLVSRGVVLQGAVPPISPILVGLTLFFIHQTLVKYRLIDLNELLSKIAVLVLSAALLVLVEGVTVMWVGTFVDYPIHSTFQIFLASVVFLALYDPVRRQVTWLANRLFNQRGEQLAATLEAIRSDLPQVTSTHRLVDALLGSLHASGRVPACSIYLWDDSTDGFVCAGQRGDSPQLLETVGAQVFVEPLVEGEPWYIRTSVSRRARTDSAWAEIGALMDAMDAELTVPFVSGTMVLGWMHLRGEDWSDGFSVEEIQRLRGIADQVTMVLRNIQDFEKREQEHRLAALGAMAAGLAHEIRNPLAGIKGAAQFLQGEELPELSMDMLQVVVDETDRLNTVVSQFLDYARPARLHLEEVDLGELVGQAVALVRAGGLPDGVEVDVETEPLTILADRGRISQVLLNLLRNGLQAMPAGGELRVRVARVGEQVELAVADTGVGIAPEDREQLFTPFFTTKRDGTGLGLAICRRLVRAHGGEIEVRSAVARGSDFVVRLPLEAQLSPTVP